MNGRIDSLANELTAPRCICRDPLDVLYHWILTCGMWLQYFMQGNSNLYDQTPAYADFCECVNQKFGPANSQSGAC